MDHKLKNREGAPEGPVVQTSGGSVLIPAQRIKIPQVLKQSQKLLLKTSIKK